MVDITAPRFMGLRQFHKCLNGARMTADGFDSNGDLLIDEPNDMDAVLAIQNALGELGYNLSSTGIYDKVTADAVREFKITEKLDVPAGMSNHDGVTGPGTSRRLNAIFTTSPVPVDERVIYTDRKSYYNRVALEKAHVFTHADWNPDLGFHANRATIVDVYGYYRDLYLALPDVFLWAGLARMAGGAVVGGLDQGASLVRENVMVCIGKDIFEDLAWQHEAYLDKPDEIVYLAKLHDMYNNYPLYDNLDNHTYVRRQPAQSYESAWKKIRSGDPAQISEGNRDLLENEQASLVQPHYDFLLRKGDSWSPTPYVEPIHPYHRAFLIEKPQGNVLLFADRWSWITSHMWTKWVEIGTPERQRLTSLSFADICSRNFGIPGRPELLPPGGP